VYRGDGRAVWSGDRSSHDGGREGAAEASTDERAWVWVEGLGPETDYRYRYRVDVDGEDWAAGELWDWVPSERGG
jgi:tartrate-resistant acid phosphatase type 5